MTPKNIVYIALAAILVIVGLPASCSLVEYVDASQIVGIQSLTGNLSWHTTQGPVGQWGGKVVTYMKRENISFSAADAAVGDDGQVDPDGDNRLPIRFFEGGTGKIIGSISIEPPQNAEQLTEMHTQFPDQRSLIDKLVRPALDKSLYVTGSLMTSNESYKEKRSQLVQLVEDQIQNGVYLTVAKEVEITDAITGEKRRATMAEIAMDDNGQPKRAESGQLARFGIKAYNFAIKDIDYDKTVDEQIQQQQTITIAVQTSIAKAKEAEQDKLTAEARGAANAATAKWEQEQINAKIVAEADGAKRAAELNKQAAEFTKAQQILLGQGEAERKRLVMAADGALEKKLEAYVQAQSLWANAFKDFKGNVVPSVVTGSSGGSNNAALNMMELLSIKAAKDLSLDLRIKD